jgi:hypothetical protein
MFECWPLTEHQMHSAYSTRSADSYYGHLQDHCEFEFEL